MATLARQSGGGFGAAAFVQLVGSKFGAFWGKAASNAPESVWALIIALFSVIHLDLPALYFIPITVAAYCAMQMGHGTFYTMQGYRSTEPGRIQTIEKIIRPIFTRLGGDILRPAYSWACMGFKGFGIGLPLFPFGLLLTGLQPLAYWLGFRVMQKDDGRVEWLAGGFTGAVMVLSIL